MTITVGLVNRCLGYLNIGELELIWDLEFGAWNLTFGWGRSWKR